MPTLESLSAKSVMVKLRDQKPMSATVKSVEPAGIWLAGADVTRSLGAVIQNGAFFLPWANVDWIATKD
jgi:hypothetical protein